jgi:hypothetical protein
MFWVQISENTGMRGNFYRLTEHKTKAGQQTRRRSLFISGD